MNVGAVLVDFDGTACLHDVAEHLLREFGDPAWPTYDEAVERGAIGLREAISAQDGMLMADRRTMLSYALEHCPMDPTFAPFVLWLREHHVEVMVVSDGFGFYIEPLMAAAGIEGVAIVTNEQRWDRDDRVGGLAFVNGHPECIGCGTCKMLAVLQARERHGAVAFAGEGKTDRYGALYADVTFAKLDLVAHCERDGVPYVAWDTFDDIRAWLEADVPLPGPVSPVACPGWTLPPS